MPSVTHDDAPPLADLMPWSVAPPRLGRGWPTGPDAASLKARWDALLKAEGPDREALFEPTRSRTLRSAVGQLPGRTGGTERLARATGPCPEPVRVLHAPFDEQWLIPDHRLIDAARPELWRVADEEQVFVVETPSDGPGPQLLATSVLPLLRPGRIRPLYRRPGGTEPNLAPGLLEHLRARLGVPVEPLDVLAWILTAVRPDLSVPLTDDPELWSRGVESGHRTLWLMRRDGDRPKLPGGRRPYVRAPLPSHPLALDYDRDEEALLLDEGRISPVPPEAWDFEAGGVRVLEQWFTARVTEPEPGTLAAIRPATWPQTWTSELLELITVLALLADLEPPQEELTSRITTNELRKAGVLPAPDSARRPASVLDGHEEGPEGQLTLI
ncbi:type ISP restriction/modification enzyme [Streptomyces griseorubiginosus]|uniref:type ISP restriction/modification enzyme n=1 Tax=Streptomyces griseorubiginosus TaxID=67304 RepID=UPI002E80A4FB|nr:type ISP restriction/modification enzyme [Streptomyces griseorubiginosus]WUB48193.1 DNA methyltransferase [Streptomyces griseorubiginosus]WUB56718.1 DNA methyltransferase [Streptomyces griseorubiginosus]